MKRFPVLVPARAAPLGGIVHEPDGQALACAVALHGRTGRSGPNRVWARLADSLCELGIVVLRFDYPGFGESVHLRYDHATAEESAREAMVWFREQTRGLDLLLVGRCGGARACIEYATTGNVAGLALVVPAIQRIAARNGELVGWWRFVSRVSRVAPGMGRRLARARTAERLDPAVARSLEAIGTSPSPWILVGDRDHQWSALWRPGELPPALAAARIDVVPGMRLHTNSTLGAQQTMIDRVTGWAREELAAKVVP